MSLIMPKALLLDMDGVVVDSMSAHCRTWKEIFRQEGIDMEPREIYIREGMKGPESIRELFSLYGKTVSDEELEGFIARKHILFEQENVKIFPRIEDILRWAEEKSLPLALVTGSRWRTINYLFDESFIARFNAVVTADDVVNGKPDPEPYRKACEAIGIVPSDALVVENAPMGIRSALAAGASCVALETTLDSSDLGEAAKIFSSHAELYDWIESL